MIAFGSKLDLPWAVNLNRKIMDLVFKNFAEKYLPAYQIVLLEEDDDALGLLFVLRGKDGSAIDLSTAKKIFLEFIAPNWSGFSDFAERTEDKYDGHDYLIYISLNRMISTYSEILILALGGVLAWEVVKQFKGRFPLL